MDKDAIFNLIDSYHGMYETPIVETTGYHRYVPRIVNKINKYINSQFYTKESPDIRRVFLNITWPYIINKAKNTDLDTKDVYYKAKSPKDRMKAYFLNRVLKDYNDKNNMGYFLNKLNIAWNTYGTVIIRDGEEVPEIVNLEDIWWDVHAKPKDNTFELQGDFVIYNTELTIKEIEDKENVWKNIDIVKEKYDRLNKKTIQKGTVKVLDCEMLCPNKLFDGKKGYHFYHVVVAYDDEFGLKEVLFYDKIKGLSYMSFSGGNKGRANFKIGTAEETFPEQKEVNRAGTSIGNSIDLAGTNIYQTQDPTTAKNILEDARNGDIFNMNIQHVDTSLPNANLFFNYKEMIEGVGRNKTNSQEFLTGETLPTNQTLGGQVLSTQMGGKWFEMERESFGLFIDEIYNKWIIPKFEKSLKKEDVISILDIDELRDIWNVRTNQRIVEMIVRNLFNHKTVPSREEIEMVKQQEAGKMEKENLWKVTKDYLTNFERDLYVDTSGEKYNVAQRIATLSQILLNSNIVDILSNPATSKAAERLLEDAGVDKSLIDAEAAQQQAQQQMQLQQQAQQPRTPQSAIENLSKQFTKEGALTNNQ